MLLFQRISILTKEFNMKLTKISLATIVALGAFSSVASATPLEEAIKNVDLSGYARYRYTNTHKKHKDDFGRTDLQGNNNGAGHQFRAFTTFKAALDDNFFGVLTLRYESTDDSGKAGNATNTTNEFDVAEVYLGYKVGNTVVTAGKQPVGTIFTDDLIGTGLVVKNSDIQGLTLTAVAFDALQQDGLELDVDYRRAFLGNNLYAVGAQGSYDPISFQLWYASLTDVVNLIAAEVGGNFDVTNDFNLGAKAQYVHSNASSKISGLTGAYNDANFYAAELNSNFFGADLALGYIGWKVDKNNNADRNGIIALEDKGGFLNAGETAFDVAEGGLSHPGSSYTRLYGKGNFFYTTLGYSFNDFRIGGDIVTGKIKRADDTKEKINEYVARAEYKYSKKLSFVSWYSLRTDKIDSDKEKQNRFRFQAKYSF